MTITGIEWFALQLVRQVAMEAVELVEDMVAMKEWSDWDSVGAKWDENQEKELWETLDLMDRKHSKEDIKNTKYERPKNKVKRREESLRWWSLESCPWTGLLT